MGWAEGLVVMLALELDMKLAFELEYVGWITIGTAEGAQVELT